MTPAELKEFIKVIEDNLQNGLNIRANNQAYKLLPHYPDNIRLLQLYSLSLARLGVPQSAKEYLEKAHEMDTHNIETIGMLGRVYKDLFKETREARYAEMSRDIYLEGYSKSSLSYPGINAASMSLVTGSRERARSIAAEIIVSVQKTAKSYWDLASLGEAHLILGNTDKALAYYSDALEASGNRIGDISSSYQQLLFLSEYMEIPEELLTLFEPPGIAVFVGHMIDTPDRSKPRFPDTISHLVKEEIGKVLDDKNIRIGYCSAACGGDLLFIEAMLERGREVNVTLPFNEDDFIKTSIDIGGQDWVKRFRSVLDRVSVSYVTDESFFGGDDIYRFLGKVLIGRSILRADVVLSKPVLLTVLHPDSELKEGGTADLDRIWPFKNNRINIDPAVFITEAEDTTAREKPEPVDSGVRRKIPRGIKHAIRCILFADIVGYSKLHEEQTPYFMYEVLHAISRQMKKLPGQPKIINTWGDALFAVGNKASHLIELAFLLKNLFRDTDWEEKHLPSGLSIRIAIHAGPVFIGRDPIRDESNSYGSHINRTARLEPITLPGCVYASAQFAALLKLETKDKYRYQYVGQLELPKNTGYQEVYHISEQHRS